MQNDSSNGLGRLPGRRRRALIAASLLVACAAAPGAAVADKVEVQAEIAAASELNPDYQGRPSPVSLILFQLAAADGFRNADFFSLYSDPEAAVLGGDLIERTQMVVRPGDVRPFVAEFDEEARFIGVVAGFRDIENAEWRGLVELPQKGFFKRVFSRDTFFVELGALSVAVKVE